MKDSLIKKLIFVAPAWLCCSGIFSGALAGEVLPRQILIHDGANRTYVVRMPIAVGKNKKRVPLVMVLHGGGGNAEVTERMTGFSAKAENEGFIVVYPEGSSRFKDKLLTWNAGHCCGYAMGHRVDDVGFIGALIDRLIRDYPVDPRRVYVTGMSNGGMMSHRLGIELSSKLAAIAPVVGTLFGDEQSPAHPVSAIMINGMLDKSVPHEGGPAGGRFAGAWDGTPTQPALAQAEFWARANRCSPDPVQEQRGPLMSWHYRCAGGRAVELHLLKDTGHAWPGGLRGSSLGDAPGTTLNATDVIWNFFRNRSR